MNGKYGDICARSTGQNTQKYTIRRGHQQRVKMRMHAIRDKYLTKCHKIPGATLVVHC